MLQGAEGRLAVLGEDLRDRAARTLLDHLVAIGERQLEPGGEQGPDRGLARTHEADEDDHGDSGLPWAGVVPSTGSAADVAGLIAYANAHFEAAQVALRAGDFAT